jgi:methanogenic corrinoid protein MtbC1
METSWLDPAAIDRTSPLPVHHQLATLLRAAIDAGHLRAGEQLPAEKLLAARLGLARGTVRQALARLMEEGLLDRRHGWGTFVAADAAPRPLTPLAAAVLPALQTRYGEALLAGDGGATQAVVTAALREGLTAETVAESILRPAAAAVGEHWEGGQASVAEEHRATAILERDLAGLHHRGARLPATGQTLVIGCVAGEQHALGSRLVADAFERAGWAVHYLGADVPVAAFASLARAVAADLVGLSVTMHEHVPGVAALARALHERDGRRPPLLVGGQPFLGDPTLARSLGAWRSADSAIDAVQLATASLGRRPDGRREP